MIATLYLYALRLFAVIPMTTGIIMLYDGVFSTPLGDEAVVTARHICDSAINPREPTEYTVDVNGLHTKSGDVSLDFYKRIRRGDTLRLKLNPVTGYWRGATQVRNGSVIYQYHSNWPLVLGFLGSFFIVVPACAYAEPRVLRAWKILPNMIVTTELVVVACLVSTWLAYAISST